MSVASQPATVTPPRGWFRRNWKWFLPTLFVVSVVAAAIAAFSYVQIRARRLRQNPTYQMALAEVQRSKQVQDRLGQPIVDSDWNPSGRIDVRDNAALGDASFNFDIKGPNGAASVLAQGRMVDGEWALTGLDVRLADGDVIRLTDEVFTRQAVDTPEFVRQAKPQANHETKTKEPAPEVEVVVPEVPPGLK
jgi:hypothetical protein